MQQARATMSYGSTFKAMHIQDSPECVEDVVSSIQPNQECAGMQSASVVSLRIAVLSGCGAVRRNVFRRAQQRCETLVLRKNRSVSAQEFDTSEL